MLFLWENSSPRETKNKVQIKKFPTEMLETEVMWEKFFNCAKNTVKNFPQKH